MENIIQLQTSQEEQTMSQEDSPAASVDQSFLRALSSPDKGGYDEVNPPLPLADGMALTSSPGDPGTAFDMNGTLSTDVGSPLRPEDLDILTPKSIISTQGMQDVVLHTDRASAVKQELLSPRASGGLQQPFITAGSTQDGAPAMERRSQCTGIRLSLLKELYERYRLPIKTDPKESLGDKTFRDLVDEIQRSILQDVLLHTDRISSEQPGLKSHRAADIPQQILASAESTRERGHVMELRSQCTGIHLSLMEEFYARYRPIKPDQKDRSTDKTFLELVDEIHRSIFQDVLSHTNRTSSVKPELESPRAADHLQLPVPAGSAQQGDPAMELRSQCTGIHESLWELLWRRC